MYVSSERDHPAFKPSLIRNALYFTPQGEETPQLIRRWLVVNEEQGYIVIPHDLAPNKRKIMHGKVEIIQ